MKVNIFNCQKEHQISQTYKFFFILSSLKLLICQVFLVISSLVLVASCQDADWTCDECLEGGSALGDWLGNEENIQGTTDLLVFDVCPQHPDPAYCEANLPAFWAILGPIVFKEHYCHICDDREECPHSEECTYNYLSKTQLAVPSCDSCKARINGACDALAWEETITAWIAGKVHISLLPKVEKIFLFRLDRLVSDKS